jgi:hypothetical protein
MNHFIMNYKKTLQNLGAFFIISMYYKGKRYFFKD